METHERFMREALKEAQKAFDAKEVPVGCVVVCQGVVIGRGHNLTERLTDATAHAEMQAITAAANHIGGKYLIECALYVTLEPCVMCAGAIYWSQLGGLVWGASDEKRGFSKISPTIIHPKTEVTKGVLAEESEKLLKDFFKKLR
ncbi:MAG: nucleoside deaminase [Flavobacteriaceae bacterium]|nr:nucleoside deaminase [Flavobacteriaceae bacterium]